jgi:tRNA dimethylallyltransferase
MQREDQRPRILFLMGPTASGKTRLACELATRHPLELVSVDSALVYRGMDVGTAKPDAATLARHPHRLIDIRDPCQAYSAAEFRDDALAELAQIAASGRVALLVGGTGLYFRALERGLSALPQADAQVRAALTREAEEQGTAVLHQRLQRLDPAAAERLNANDRQRVLRALEVIELSGRPISEQRGQTRARLPYHVLKLALLPKDRAPLHARIAERLDTMIEGGLRAELERLRALPGWLPDLPSMRAVGYRQGWPWLEGRIDLPAYRLSALHATRQLAKRQITWLRSEVDALAFDPESADVGERLDAAVAAFLPG